MSRPSPGGRRFGMLFDAAADGILLVHPDRRCADANRPLADMLGQGREELTGRDVAEMVVPEEQAAMRQAVAELAAGSAWRREWHFLRREGGTVPVEVSASLLPDRCLLFIARNILDREQSRQALAASERHYRELFEQAAEAIFQADRSGRCIEANPAACTLTGYSRGELLAMRFADLAAEAGTLQLEPLMQRLEAGATVESEWSVRRKDGSVVLLQVKARRMADGSFHAFAIDITERRRAEETLRRRAEDLERFHRLSVGRELQMIELKRRINALSSRLGEPLPYDLSLTGPS